MTEHRGVGLTKISATVSGRSGERVTVELLVDSGATYTVLPEAVWRRLGLSPTRTRKESFHLADLTTIERDISECYIELPEVDGERLAGHTPVILGESADVALLGVLTLESVGLILNPLERSIHKATAMPLMRMTA